MNRASLLAVGALVIVLGIFGAASVFTVHQAEQALVVQLGEAQSKIRAPGLNFKLPFIQNVVYFDLRVLDLEPPVESVTLSDQKRLDVDTFVRYRIIDPLLYYQSTGTEAIARSRLTNLVTSSLRQVLGNVDLNTILSGERERVMSTILKEVDQEARRFGMQIVDVRMKRADLPEQAAQSVFARMRSEREREAAEARAQGFELGQQIRASADRERTVLLAESKRMAEILRGEGEGQANRIWGEAFGKDQEFFRFYRSMQAYRGALRDEDTTIIISPDSDFFRYFGSPAGTSAPAPAR